MTSRMQKLTPVLIVNAIEPCLPFWTERLGFTTVAQVPDGDGLGFVILEKDGVEIMYQTRESVRKDLPSALGAEGHSMMLFVEVADVGAVERALDGMEPVMPRRTTFYGMDEIGVREPGGALVVFAQKV